MQAENPANGKENLIWSHSFPTRPVWVSIGRRHKILTTQTQSTLTWFTSSSIKLLNQS